jgi:DNA-binding transcriptional regulator YiaG
MSFKKELRKWRGKRLQKQAADLLKVKAQTYSTWEQGRRTPSDLARLELRRRMYGC